MNKQENSLFTELRGNGHCLIEGVDRLLRYNDNIISILAGKLTVSINGNELTLDCLAENRIGIRGKIVSVTFGECDVV